jgi:hypothetical protein
MHNAPISKQPVIGAKKSSATSANSALAETEAWLRSHRERPLHPALG